ncbi:MAG: DUF3431 domain-containing protein [Desulfovibrio sp.]
MTKTLQIIVARYNEDLSWLPECIALLEELSDLQCSAIVYDKSNNPLPGAVSLPNTGRESHTYLSHIVRKCSELSDYNVFLQGNPFPHLLQEQNGDVSNLVDKILQYVQKDTPFGAMAWFKYRCDALGQPHDLRKPENKGRWNGWGRDIPVGAVFQKLFAMPVPQTLICRGMTGNFMVTRERILCRTLAFYMKALAIIEADSRDEYNTGHAFERLWGQIFSGAGTRLHSGR